MPTNVNLIYFYCYQTFGVIIVIIMPLSFVLSTKGCPLFKHNGYLYSVRRENDDSVLLYICFINKYNYNRGLLFIGEVIQACLNKLVLNYHQLPAYTGV